MGVRELDVAPRVLAQFVALVDAGEPDAAATALGVPARTIGRAVVTLEAEVGEPLLLTRADRLELTPAGHAVSRTAREVLDALAHLRGVAEADDATLRVAHVAHADTLSILLDAFDPVRPGTRVLEATVPDDRQVEEVRRHQIDVAVCAPAATLPADLAAAPLRRDPLLVIGSQSRGAPSPVEHLAPTYGRAWPGHDLAVDELERELGVPISRAPVPSEGGHGYSSLVRRARGRQLVMAASAVPHDTRPPDSSVLDRHLSWQLVWRRDDHRLLTREFVASALGVARQRGWTDPAAYEQRHGV